MRSPVMYAFILLVFLAGGLSAQILTKEKRKTVGEKGDTTVSQSEIISTSEDITPRNDMLTINPLKFILFYNLTYYHRINSSSAVGIGLQLPTVKDFGGAGVNLEYRWYPSRKSLRGFYIAPNASYNSLSLYSENAHPISLGILLGWQWFPGDEFAIGLGIGADYYFSSSSDSFRDYDGSAPALRFDIGYAW